MSHEGSLDIWIQKI